MIWGDFTSGICDRDFLTTELEHDHPKFQILGQISANSGMAFSS
jgi:hypothetical protein